MRLALIRHDAAIAAAFAWQVTGRWRDLLTVVVALPIVALFLRAWLAELATGRRDMAIGAAGFLIAAALAKAAIDRLFFHQTEGAMAHHAQRLADALGYLVPVLAGGLGLLFAGLLAIGGGMSGRVGACLLAGIAVGVSSARATGWLGVLMRGTMPDMPRVFRQGWGLVLAAGLSAAVGLICAMLPGDTYLAEMIGAGYLVFVGLATGRVDAATVRYKAMVGMSSAQLLRTSAPLQLALLLPATAVLAMAQDWMAASVAAIAAFALPAITILRTCAYRAFSRMLADWVVAILLAVSAWLTLALPPLGPLALIAAIAWLVRRGRNARWLIA